MRVRRPMLRTPDIDYETIRTGPFVAEKRIRQMKAAQLPPNESDRLAALRPESDRLFGAEKAILRATDLPFGVSILLIAERP